MSNENSRNVPAMLRECAKVFEQRHEIYGDNYKDFGKVMVGLFPGGLIIQSVADWNRLGLLIQIVSKLGRYANNFVAGGHDDSLLDQSVYAAMLREIDESYRTEPAPGPEEK